MFSNISFTHIQRELWSFTVLTYQCEPRHSFKWGEESTRVCSSDGNWDNNDAPICVPGKLTFYLSYN